MDQLLQHLLNGLLLGSTYSLLGIGLTLVFGLMNVVNFAHGEFYTLGAYAAFAALVGALRELLPRHPARHRGRRAGGRGVRARAAPPAARESIDTHHAGDDRALDRAAERASCSVWGGVAKSVPTPFPTSAAGPGARVGVAPLRVFVFAASRPR